MNPFSPAQARRLAGLSHVSPVAKYFHELRNGEHAEIFLSGRDSVLLGNFEGYNPHRVLEELGKALDGVIPLERYRRETGKNLKHAQTIDVYVGETDTEPLMYSSKGEKRSMEFDPIRKLFFDSSNNLYTWLIRKMKIPLNASKNNRYLALTEPSLGGRKIKCLQVDLLRGLGGTRPKS